MTDDASERTSNSRMSYCLFTTGSLVLTAAMLACGMAFFSPYWLENLKVNGTFCQVA